MSALPNVTYLLPIRRRTVPLYDELTTYLPEVAGAVRDVVVVDGSLPAVFAAHAAAWGSGVRHVPVDPACGGANGKVAGVRTGMALARTEYVIIADDDVRYGPAELEAVSAALAHADVVRPQNYFDPLPWHALLDEGRSLIARATGGDWPGTLGVRRSTYLRTGGYDPNVLFENLELVRTICAAGGTERLLEDVFVVRRPPTVSQYFDQRVRQAYDEFARPARLAVQLALAPAAALFLRQTGLAGSITLTVLASALAEAGRRRAGASRHFPPAASLCASLWVVERAMTSWIALGARLGGGIPYAGQRLRAAATPPRILRKRLFEVHT
jgi:glycosyl transferase family 21